MELPRGSHRAAAKPRCWSIRIQAKLGLLVEQRVECAVHFDPGELLRGDPLCGARGQLAGKPRVRPEEITDVLWGDRSYDEAAPRNLRGTPAKSCPKRSMTNSPRPAP